MDYSKLIVKAIQNNEVVNLLRGDVGYEVPVSQFTSDVFPTEINEVLEKIPVDDNSVGGNRKELNKRRK